MAYIAVSKAAAFGHKGSNPFSPTKKGSTLDTREKLYEITTCAEFDISNGYFNTFTQLGNPMMQKHVPSGGWSMTITFKPTWLHEKDGPADTDDQVTIRGRSFEELIDNAYERYDCWLKLVTKDRG